jgi:membrane protein YqaA with SNARE-associated domain
MKKRFNVRERLNVRKRLSNLDDEQKRRIRKWAITFFIIFFIAIAIIFLSVLFKYSTIQAGIKTYVSVYGLIAIFIIAFLLDAVEQPIGPEIPIIAGILSGINIYLVVIFTSLGSTLASMMGYWLGRKYGQYGFLKIYPEKKYHKWREKYLKNGNLLLALAALTPVPYVIVCWISGMFGMRRSNFLLFGIVPRIARIISVAYLTLILSI